MTVSRRTVMKVFSVALLILSVTVAASGQSIDGTNMQDKGNAKPTSSAYRNERLKRAEDPDHEITGDSQWRRVDGMWVPESNHPANELLFLEQVTITCRRQPSKTCEELRIILAPFGGLIFVDGVDETTWEITSWDEHGLLATRDADPSSRKLDERCYRHVLSMSFRSGAVSTSDIPTHDKGCEMFPETDSYKLVRGQYYVDTTPGNDADKPVRLVTPRSQK